MKWLLNAFGKAALIGYLSACIAFLPGCSTVKLSTEIVRGDRISNEKKGPIIQRQKLQMEQIGPFSVSVSEHFSEKYETVNKYEKIKRETTGTSSGVGWGSGYIFLCILPITIFLIDNIRKDGVNYCRYTNYTTTHMAFGAFCLKSVDDTVIGQEVDVVDSDYKSYSKPAAGTVELKIRNNTMAVSDSRALSLDESGQVNFDKMLLSDKVNVNDKVELIWQYAGQSLTTKIPQHEVDQIASSRTPPYLSINKSVDYKGKLTEGLLPAEENGSIGITLKNDGKGMAFNVKLAVSGAAPSGVDFPTSFDIGELKPGASHTVFIPVSATLEAKNADLNLTVQAKEQFGKDSLPMRLPTIAIRQLDQPKLVIGSIEFSDRGGLARGNGNGIPENNETMELTANVKNIGIGTAKGVRLRLKDMPRGSESSLKEVEVGNIPAGGEKEGKLTLTLPKFFKPTGNPSEFPVTLEVSDNRPINISDSKSSKIPYTYNEPRVMIAGVEVFDGDDPKGNTRGNGNHLIEQAEIVELRYTLENKGTMRAEDVTVSLSANQKNIHISPPSIAIGRLDAGQKNKDASFLVDIPASIEPGSVTFSLKVNQKDYDALADNRPFNIGQQVLVADAPVKQTGSAPGRVSAARSSEQLEDVPFLQDFRRNNAHALVVGIGNYRRGDVPKLKYAADDARVMERFLVNIGGIPKENVRTLINDDATLSSIRAELEDLNNRANDDSQVFVYFAGHGIAHESAPYLLPYDGYLERKSTAFPISELKGELNKLRSKNIMVALDSCYSGAGRSTSAPGQRAGIIRVDEDKTATRAVILSASTSEQTSHEYPDKSHGIFTYFMLKGMRGEAPDLNGDGYVDADELYAYLSKEVPQVAREKHGKQQTPVLTGNGRGVVMSKRIAGTN